MAPRIKNVRMGKASIDSILSSTGAYSCIIVVILLSDNKVFIHHASSDSFDLENSNVPTEIEKLVRDTMFKLYQLNANGLLIEKIYMIGGSDERTYQRFHDTLSQMKSNHSSLTPTFTDLNIYDLRNFYEIN